MSTRTELQGPPLRSLAWAGDELIDWIGGHRIGLDGAVQRFGVGDPYRFDAAAGLGDLGVMYETLGTKGRLVRWNGQLASPPWVPIGFDEIRELDRSYYQAEVYAYPVCLLMLPDGRPALAHCPARYDTLELELLDGSPLTRRSGRSEDIFHAKLAASPDGRWLLSNGWVWHPISVLCVYDVALALAEPAHLSGPGLRLDLGEAFDGDVECAALLGDLVVAGGGESPVMSVVELPTGRNLACIPLDQALGTRLVAWGPERVVALDGRPRVMALDGTVVETLDAEVPPWHQPNVSLEPPQAPYLAVDPLQPRFAVGADDGRIVVFSQR